MTSIPRTPWRTATSNTSSFAMTGLSPRSSWMRDTTTDSTETTEPSICFTGLAWSRRGSLSYRRCMPRTCIARIYSACTAETKRSRFWMQMQAGDMSESQDTGVVPSSAEEGWLRDQQMQRSHLNSRRRGGVDQVQSNSLDQHH